MNSSEEQCTLSDVAIALHLPMYFTGLVIENTNRCNASCDHCYQCAGPRGSRNRKAEHLELDVMIRCIREAAELSCIGSRLHLAGGEAFLYMEECIRLVEEAKRCQIQQIGATTNAFWAKDLKEARSICSKLKEAGLTSLEVSCDYWHHQNIPPEAVNHCLIACREVDIDTNLRFLTTRAHSIEECISYISPEALGAVSRITSGPVFGTGRAKEKIDCKDLYQQRDSLHAVCYNALNLTISSSGDVFPCCAGFDQTKEYLIGNVKEKSLKEITQAMNCNPILRRLVFRGPYSFLPILKKYGFTFQTEEYNTACQLCYTIFTHAEYVKCIEEEFRKRQNQSIMNILDQLIQEENTND